MIHAFILGSLANGLYILRGTGICTLMNLCAERWSVRNSFYYAQIIVNCVIFWTITQFMYIQSYNSLSQFINF